MFAGSIGGTGEYDPSVENNSEEEKVQTDTQLQNPVLITRDRISQLTSQQPRAPVTMINQQKFDPLHYRKNRYDQMSNLELGQSLPQTYAVQNNLITSMQFLPNTASNQSPQYKPQRFLGNSMNTQLQQTFKGNDLNNNNSKKHQMMMEVQSYNYDEEIKQDQDDLDRNRMHQLRDSYNNNVPRKTESSSQFRQSSGIGVDAGVLSSYKLQNNESKTKSKFFNTLEEQLVEDLKLFYFKIIQRFTICRKDQALRKAFRKQRLVRYFLDDSQIQLQLYFFMIQQELTKMLSIPKNKKYLDDIEEAEDNQSLDKIRQSLVNDDNFMSDIQKVIENKFQSQSNVTNTFGNAGRESSSLRIKKMETERSISEDEEIEKFDQDDDEIEFDIQY